MEVILLRHGQTAGNQKGRYNGRTDEPLSGEGIRQARRAGVLPQVKKVYVTPMLRTRQTAAVCFPNAEQVLVPGLNEMDFGDFEGRTADEMEHDMAYRAWVDGNCQGSCPNGESIGSFRERVCQAFQRMVLQAREAGEDTLYAVVHGGTIMAALSAFTGQEERYFDFYVKNCQGWRGTLDTAGGLRFTQTEFFERLQHEDHL